MLLYIAIIFIVFRTVQFIIKHKGADKNLLMKMVGLLILEYVALVLGVIGVVGILGGGKGSVLNYIILITGVILLIVSGRAGWYARKLAKGETDQPIVASTSEKKKLKIAQVFTFVSFLIFTFAWQFYASSFMWYAAILYLTSLVLFVVSIRYSSRSRSDQSLSRGTIWSIILLNCFFAFLDSVMLLGILIKAFK